MVSGEEKAKTTRILAVIVEQGTTMQDRQLQDSAIGPVLLAKDVNQYPPDKVKAFNMEGRCLTQIWDQLMVKDDVLYRALIGRGNYESLVLFIVPQTL